MSKFCKVCFDAGKDDSVFKSHFVRSGIGMNNAVVCPIWLSIKCKYCHQNGHTVKFCEVLKDNEKNKRRYEYERKIFNATDGDGKRSNKRKMNIFDTLIADSDNDENDEAEVLVETETKTELQGWAAIVAKKQVIEPAAKQEIKSTTISSNLYTMKPHRIYNWDYDSDSD